MPAVVGHLAAVAVLAGHQAFGDGQLGGRRILVAGARDGPDDFGVALFERDRLRLLLEVLGGIDKATDEATMPPLVASLAIPLLEADRVVVAIERDGVLVLVGEGGEAAAGTADQVADDVVVEADAVAADVTDGLERGSEFFCFVDPVKNQALGCDDEAWELALFFAREQKG